MVQGKERLLPSSRSFFLCSGAHTGCFSSAMGKLFRDERGDLALCFFRLLLRSAPAHCDAAIAGPEDQNEIQTGKRTLQNGSTRQCSDRTEWLLGGSTRSRRAVKYSWAEGAPSVPGRVESRYLPSPP